MQKIYTSPKIKYKQRVDNNVYTMLMFMVMRCIVCECNCLLAIPLVVMAILSCCSAEQVEVAQVPGRLLRDCHFTVIEDDPSSLLLDVTHIVPAHGGRPHVTDNP